MTTTIEQTGKIWKLLQTFSIVFILFGTVGWIAGNVTTAPTMLILGSVCFIITKIGSWWYHG